MSGHGKDWAELAFQHERLVGQSIGKLTDICTVTSVWTELASRNERLVDPGDPHFRLTSPEPHAPRRVRIAMKDRRAS
jgi:hypothetical protein